MSSNTYNALVSVLMYGATITFVLGVAYLIAAVVGWRGQHRRKRLVRCAALFLALPVFVIAQQVLLWRVFLPSLAREQRRQHEERIDAVSVVHLGNPAPSFSVTDTSGREFVLHAQRGKVVLVTFFATWCGPCIQELPHVQKLWDDNRENQNFALIVVGREETNESVGTFQSKHGYTFPVASDPERSVYSLYAKELIPRTYLVSPDGRICFSSTGFDEEEMANLKRELAKQLRSTQ